MQEEQQRTATAPLEDVNAAPAEFLVPPALAPRRHAGGQVHPYRLFFLLVAVCEVEREGVDLADVLGLDVLDDQGPEAPRRPADEGAQRLLRAERADDRRLGPVLPGLAIEVGNASPN